MNAVSVLTTRASMMPIYEDLTIESRRNYEVADG